MLTNKANELTAIRQRLVGAWALESFRVELPKGQGPLYPFGADAVGLLLYSAEGMMSAFLSRVGRAPLPVGRLEAVGRAPAGAKARAFDEVLSYAGTWRLEAAEHAEAAVIHQVEMATVPDIVGSMQRRFVHFQSGALRLEYRLPLRDGSGEAHYALQWVRAEQVSTRI